MLELFLDLLNLLLFEIFTKYFFIFEWKSIFHKNNSFYNILIKLLLIIIFE